MKRNNLQGQVVELETEKLHLENEIERLNKQIEEYQKALDETTSEKIDLENILKEVREYINWRLEEHQDMYKYQMEELLEILDKVD